MKVILECVEKLPFFVLFVEIDNTYMSTWEYKNVRATYGMRKLSQATQVHNLCFKKWSYIY